MSKIGLAFKICSAFFSASVCWASHAASSLPQFNPRTFPAIAADFKPSMHLSNCIGKNSCTFCYIGDSTATVGPTAGNNVDPSQIVWGFVQNKLLDDNPLIPKANWSFQNFAIGATTEAQPLLTGTALQAAGVALPPFFTNLGNTWLSYPQAANCDALGWQFGTNASTSGQAAGSSTATFIRQNFEVINGWTKPPNIIIVTTKPTNTLTDTTDDSVSSGHIAQANFHRSFARSNAAGYTSFTNLTALGFGLIDLGRYFTAAVYGYDPDAQYFQTKPASIVNGLPLVRTAVIGTTSGTIGTTTHGDYRATVVLPAGGGAPLFASCNSALGISASAWASNYVRFNIASNGALVPKYVLDGNISGAPLQTGSSVATTSGQDVTITVSASGDRVQATINGTLALDVLAPRLITGAAGGTPINFGCLGAVVGSQTVNVTEFYEGIGQPTTGGLYNQQQAYGFGLNIGGTVICSVTQVGCQGGNSNNHYRSSLASLDREAIYGMNFHIPSTLLGQFTVSTLPSCGSANKASQLFVTDATSPTYNATLTGGGTVGVPVSCNGTAWVSH